MNRISRSLRRLRPARADTLPRRPDRIPQRIGDERWHSERAAHARGFVTRDAVNPSLGAPYPKGHKGAASMRRTARRIGTRPREPLGRARCARSAALALPPAGFLGRAVRDMDVAAEPHGWVHASRPGTRREEVQRREVLYSPWRPAVQRYFSASDPAPSPAPRDPVHRAARASPRALRPAVRRAHAPRH